MNWKWTLLANMCLAGSLNVSTFVFIRVSSAVSFVLAGIMKDVMIVLVGIIFMGHQISGLQASGFSLQVSLVFLWSLLKTFPREFETGISGGLMMVLFGRTPPEEKQKLVEDAPGPDEEKKKPVKDVEYGS